MITQADKGKTTVIIYKQDYRNKVHTFLVENNFHPIPNNPTKKYQKTDHDKQWNLIINKGQIKHLTQTNPAPPTLKAQLKLHKAGNLIIPVNNNRNAPPYKATKKLNNILKQYLNSDNYYTIDKSTTLAQDLTKLNFNRHHRLMSLDIKYLYVNILITETTDITKQQLLKYNDLEITLQICKLLETILQQN